MANSILYKPVEAKDILILNQAIESCAVKKNFLWSTLPGKCSFLFLLLKKACFCAFFNDPFKGRKTGLIESLTERPGYPRRDK